MYHRGAKPNTIMLAVVKGTNKAFMLSSTTRNFTSTDSARGYFMHTVTLRPNEASKYFKAIYKNKEWDGFIFKMKEYQDAHSADRAFRRLKTEYEIQNIPKNPFKKASNGEPQHKAHKPDEGEAMQRAAAPAPVLVAPENHMGDEPLIAAVLANRVITFGGVRFRLRLEPVSDSVERGGL